MAKFTNLKGDGKNNAREIMVRYLKESKTNATKILSLPAEHCYIEDMLMKVGGFMRMDFELVERDRTVFNAMVKNATKVFARSTGNIGYNLKNIKDVITKAKENEYKALIYDFCGQIATFKEELEYTFDNNILDINGIMALTINKRISGNTSMDFVHDMERLNNFQSMKVKSGEELRSEAAARVFLLKATGMNYSIDEEFSYNDSSPMHLFIIRRLK